MIGVEGRLQVRSYSNEAGVRQYLSEVLVNRFTFLESKKSNNALESVDTFKEQHYPTTETSNNPYDPNFSNPNYSPTSQNYNNPFTTATTLAGSLNRAMNPISVSDDDLPF